VLQKHRWVPVKLKSRKSISNDTNVYTFELPQNSPKLVLGTCQHFQIGFHMRDRMVIRPYTPTRPLLPAKDDEEHQISLEEPANNGGTDKQQQNGNKQSSSDDDEETPFNDLDSLRDGHGTFDRGIVFIHNFGTQARFCIVIR